MPGEEVHFEDTHKACFGKIDVFCRSAQVVAAHGNDGALAGNQGVDFSLGLRQVRMGGIELLPATVGLLDLFKGIKGVKGKRFACSGQRFEVNPEARGVQTIAGAGDRGQ